MDWGQPELVVWHPSRFEDGAAIVAAVRENKAVLLHAGSMERTEAQRLIDFVAGGVSALDGQAECLDALTFLFAPALVAISQLGLGVAEPSGPQ
jgi:FtsZ-interacting cell division protein YlmF